MTSLRTLVADLTDESLRTATLVGLALIPFTVVFSRNSVTLPHEILSNDGIHFEATISGTATFVAGVVVGYHYAGPPTEIRRAGAQAGVVGSAPLLALTLSTPLALLWFSSSKIALVAAVLTPLAVGLGAGFCASVGLLGAILGDWVAERVGRGRPTDANT